MKPMTSHSEIASLKKPETASI